MSDPIAMGQERQFYFLAAYARYLHPKKMFIAIGLKAIGRHSLYLRHSILIAANNRGDRPKRSITPTAPRRSLCIGGKEIPAETLLRLGRMRAPD